MRSLRYFLFIKKKKKKEKGFCPFLDMLELVFSVWILLLWMFLALYYISEIYLFIDAAARECVSQSCIRPADRVAVENRFSLTCGLRLQFSFSRGNTCDQLMNCRLWIQLSPGRRGGESLITRTGMCLQMYRWDADSEHAHYCLCRVSFQSQAQHLEPATLSLTERILPFGSKLMWLPWWLRGKEPACHCRGHDFDPWVGSRH